MRFSGRGRATGEYLEDLHPTPVTSDSPAEQGHGMQQHGTNTPPLSDCRTHTWLPRLWAVPNESVTNIHTAVKGPKPL